MSNHTPSLATARAVFIDGAEGEFVGEDFDQMIEAVRAEEREKAAQIADDEAENPGPSFRAPRVLAQRTFAASKVAARIREQGS